ncbi:hypothetical protein SLS60_000427 [Paraconiothyrium brasiliense]|uniref:Major facilitator superfamily (MFS) profile domain-containing protein n=1 Tax=Paraconiothyrium brasiliense TaxID=300254 RepID=A0ABR3S689_9PLEO
MVSDQTFGPAVRNVVDTYIIVRLSRIRWRDDEWSTNRLMNAIYPVGKVIGLLPCTFLADRFGRKVPLTIGLFICITGAALQGASQNVGMFIAARCILGFGTSFLVQPSPILITELAFPTHRGKATATYNTFFYFGAILAAWFTYGTFPIKSTWSWRIPSLLQGALPVIQLAFVWFVPESPRWLVAHGKQGEARRILAKYHAAGDEDSPLVAYELQEIEENIRIETEVQGETSWMDLVRSAPNRKRTLIAVIVGFFAQWNGAGELCVGQRQFSAYKLDTGVVSYYLTLVLNTIGITETADQALINGLLQIFNWITAVGAGAMMVDRAGRRPLFLTSVAGMAVSYAIWTALTSTFIKSHDADAGRAVVAFIFIYYFFYNIAWSPLLLAYPVEIFPYSLRGKGVSVSLSCTFIGLIIGQFVNPIAMTAIGWKYYIVFCCILVVLFGVIYVLFPETKGRTLEQIAEVFDGKNHKAGMTEVGLKEVDDNEKMEHVRVEEKV